MATWSDTLTIEAIQSKTCSLGAIRTEANATTSAVLANAPNGNAFNTPTAAVAVSVGTNAARCEAAFTDTNPIATA